AVERGFAFMQQERGSAIHVEEGVCAHIAASCGGDVRKAFNAVELCVLSSIPDADGTVRITVEQAAELGQRSSMRYDRDGDEHYDIVSAYQKSMRGSDPDAALHYLARLLEAGDLPSACRRLMVCACEDVGLAYPQILPIVKTAVDIALQVGLPEARLPLADAVIMVATAPKSNSGHDAIAAAMADVQAGRSGPIPRQLQNKHYDGADAAVRGQHYLYPHAYPDHWVEQQYLPDVLAGTTYYVPGDNKNEQAFAAYWKSVKERRK
ncbi:MAG: replication-associated recombination protein A, partial [Clostridia bacterium]|nr:replication-associated recombination protein A [Clostridia bacterium]